MDKLQAMQVFLQIAERGSLTAAANSLDKSLPSVVRILAALEEHLQCRLLNRTTRHIALTDEGRVYLDHVRKILNEIQEAESLLQHDETEPAGTLTVTAPVRFGEMHVAPAITEFLKRYPRMQINLLLLDRIVNMLEEGIDLAVRIASLADSSMVARPIRDIRQMVVASPEFLNTYTTPEHPTDLANLPCILFSGISSERNWRFQQGAKKMTIKVDGKLSCNQIAASVNACVAGLGVGYFYCYQVMPYISQGQLVALLEQYELPAQQVSLVYQHRQLMSPRLRMLIDWLAQALSDSTSIQHTR